MPSKPRSLAGILHRRRAADAEYNRARRSDPDRGVEDAVVSSARWKALRARVLTPSSADAKDTAAPPTAHVLWVDDDPTNNRFIIDQFERRGVQVTMALNTAAALEQYSPHAYDLVISDMGRYEGTNGAYIARAGLNLLEGLRARDPDVQVVFCTSARALTEFRDSALAAGARDIVTECEVILRYLGIEPQSPR